MHDVCTPPLSLHYDKCRIADGAFLFLIQVSSVEIERICNAVSTDILETAAIGVPPPGGGPERLAVAIVFKDPDKPLLDPATLTAAFNSALQKKLNPLFKVWCSPFHFTKFNL